MAKSVLELAVGTGQWDAGLKKAKSALDNFTQANGGLQQALSKDSASMQKFVQMMGQMDSTAKTAKGQMNDYKSTIEQLTMQYNRMTDAQKQSVGQDYLRSIDQLKQKYQSVNDELQEMNRTLSQTKMPEVSSSGGGGFSDAMNGLTGKFLKANLYAMAAEKGAEALQSLGQHVIDVTKRSYELAAASEGIVLAFNRLNRPDLLDKLREATHGTVSDLELMKQAVKFDNFKLPLNDLATYLAFAQQKAKDTGESIDYLVNSIVTGLGRQSKQILDNLGISASELTKRMNEGKSMTEAVAEIIREEMDKAGGYVETASDRMARSTADVENAMLQLGTTMQETFDGASIDEISNKLEMQLIAELNSTVETIGLVKEALSGLGVEGNQVMDALINAVSQTYHNLSLLINPTMELLRLYNKFTGDEKVRIEGLHEGNEQITSPRSTTTTTPPKPPKPRGSGSSTVKTEEQENSEKIRKLSAEYEKADAKRREQLTNEIRLLQQRNAEIKYYQDLALGNKVRPMGADVMEGQGVGLNTIGAIQKDVQDALKQPIDISGFTTPLEQMQEELKKLIELRDNAMSAEGWQAGNKAVQRKQKEIGQYKGGDGTKDVNAAQEIGKMASGISSMVSGIESLGVEIPQGMKDMLGGIQGIVTLLSGISTILTAIEVISAADSIIPFAHGGVVHAAGGWSGMVPGNSFSGDNIPAMLDSGELVLNKFQQQALAANLQNNNGGGMRVVGEIQGEKIVLVANRFLKRSGQGELVTWGG